MYSKLAAVFFIAVLTLGEARRVQQGVHLRTGPGAQSIAEDRAYRQALAKILQAAVPEAAFKASSAAAYPRFGRSSLARSRPATVMGEGDFMSRMFSPAEAKGGCAIDPAKTAVMFIEYQNEFTTEGGKLHDAVKDCMAETGMLDKSADVGDIARAAGCKIFHAPIDFEEDASDNPNKAIGILAGCAKDKLFTKGTWNADFCDKMRPKADDVVISGKKGLDAFPGTDLAQKLKDNGIETLALGGFLSNCCVESTMRTAYEMGFNVITLTDCTATTSTEGQKAAAEGTYGMFSQPMTAAEFKEQLKAFVESLPRFATDRPTS